MAYPFLLFVQNLYASTVRNSTGTNARASTFDGFGVTGIVVPPTSELPAGFESGLKSKRQAANTASLTIEIAQWLSTWDRTLYQCRIQPLAQTSRKHTNTHTHHTRGLSTLGHTKACTFNSTSRSCQRLPRKQQHGNYPHEIGLADLTNLYKSYSLIPTHKMTSENIKHIYIFQIYLIALNIMYVHTSSETNENHIYS